MFLSDSYTFSNSDFVNPREGKSATVTREMKLESTGV